MYLVSKQQEERETEADDEEEEYGEELQESPENIREHHNENAESRDFPDKQDKFDPGEKHGDRSKLPLPHLKSTRNTMIQNLAYRSNYDYVCYFLINLSYASVVLQALRPIDNKSEWPEVGCPLDEVLEDVVEVLEAVEFHLYHLWKT